MNSESICIHIEFLGCELLRDINISLHFGAKCNLLISLLNNENLEISNTDYYKSNLIKQTI